MKTAAIIQARLASTRFPGKVLTSLGKEKKPALQILIDRLNQCRRFDRIIVAIPDNEPQFNTLLQSWGHLTFQGHPTNVRDRVLRAAEHYRIDMIVDITADCPLVDSDHVDALIERSLIFGYASNIDPRSWPDGFDAQVYRRGLLQTAHDIDPEAPHVGWQILNLIQSGCMMNYVMTSNLQAPPGFCYPKMRLTLDTPEDAVVIDRVLKDLGDHASATEIISYMLKRPELQEINSHIRTKNPEEG